MRAVSTQGSSFIEPPAPGGMVAALLVTCVPGEINPDSYFAEGLQVMSTTQSSDIA